MAFWSNQLAPPSPWLIFMPFNKAASIVYQDYIIMNIR